MVHGPGPQGWSMDLGSMFCIRPKSLGVYVDENLSWTTHINQITKKIASGIGALKRVRPFVPVNTLMTIFNSLVQPHFKYCCEI